MSGQGVDIVEVGRGNESKVIGQGDSISEYVAGGLTVVMFFGELSLGAWVLLACAFYWLNFTFAWSCVLAGVVSFAVYGFAVYGFLRLIRGLRDAHLPPTPRDEVTGRFIPVYQGGEHRFNLYSTVKRKIRAYRR